MALDDIEDTPGGARLSMRLHLPNGLHARPAARLAQTAQRYRSSIRIIAETGEADVKSMLDVLSLALADQTPFTIEATGTDAHEAIGAVAGFLEGLAG